MPLRADNKAPATPLDDDLVMNLVELALACPPEQRQGYLRRACSADAALFQEVWKYIEREQRMNGSC